MSLRFALLGLLDQRPSSGYDLTQRFAEGIGSYAWTANHSQIYPELKKLTAEGLIQITERGARGRKTYDVTPAGHDALREWLLGPPAGNGVRNEFVLRLFLLSALEGDEAAGILADTRRFARAQVTELQQIFDQLLDHGLGPTGGSAGMAARFGIQSYQALSDWADWAIAAIEQDPTFGRSGARVSSDDGSRR